MTIYKLHFYFQKKVLFLVFLIIISQYVFSKPAELKITENTFFEIVGSDLSSIQFTSELSEYVADSILRDLNQNDFIPPRRILVELLNTQGAFNDSNFYDLIVSNLGFVTVRIKWNEYLSLPDIIEALTVSFIQSYGYSRYGELFLDRYPSKAWIIKGLSLDIYASLRPHVARLFFEKAIIEGLDSRDFNFSFLDVNSLTNVQSFGIYRFVKSNQISSKVRERIIKNAIVGRNTVSIICDHLSLDSEESIQSSIVDFLKIQYRYNEGRFKSLTASKNWLEALGDLSTTSIIPNNSNDKSLRFLWLNQKNPSVVQFIKARIQLISLGLSQINPLYFNSAQSLALTYQKLLNGVEEWEFLYYFSDFLDELEKANELSLQIRKRLQSQLP